MYSYTLVIGRILAKSLQVLAIDFPFSKKTPKNSNSNLNCPYQRVLNLSFALQEMSLDMFNYFPFI